MKLCIVVPCYQEEDGIDAFHDETKRVLREACLGFEHEIIFVDDGSRDGTLDRLKQIANEDEHVSVYSLARNQGHQAALSAGLAQATGDAIIMMDADLQHPPALIPSLVESWQSGNDVVLAVRQETEDASAFKRLSSNLFYWVFNFLSDVKLTPGAADFCLLSQQVHQKLCEMPERRRFLRGMISWLGFQTSQVAYVAPARFAGQSGYSLGKMIKLAIDATISFSTRPIRLATKAGLAIASVGLVYLAYIFGRSILFGDLSPGWASILGTVILLGGMQLLSIGLIGEYLAHVFEEVKGRPSHVFKFSREAGLIQADQPKNSKQTTTSITHPFPTEKKAA